MEPIAYTHGGAAYCPACARSRFGTCADGEVGCYAHELPADRAGHRDNPDPVGAVFGYSESWRHGGLSCDSCGGEIVENDDCSECEKSLSSDHDTYTYGPADHPVTVGPLCPGRHGAAAIMVRHLIRPDGRPVYAQHPEPGVPSVFVEVIPFDLPRAVIDGPPGADVTAPWWNATVGNWSPAPVEDAWAAIVAAYAGHVATFDPAPADPMDGEPYATVHP